MPNRIAHFEIHADDPERAAKFYSEVFGWEVKKMGRRPNGVLDGHDGRTGGSRRN